MKWMTSNASAIPVNLMETTHLYHTLRLIWNTFSPEELQVQGREPTVFSNRKIYTADYLKQVAKEMYAEYKQRDDVKWWMLEGSDHWQMQYLDSYIEEHFHDL